MGVFGGAIVGRNACSGLHAWQPEAIVTDFAREVWLPFDLLIRAIVDPQEVLDWARHALLESEGSFFRLGAYFPSIFCIVAVAIAGRHLLHSTDAAVS